jgi:hypothetical protein
MSVMSVSSARAHLSILCMSTKTEAWGMDKQAYGT